MLRSVFLQHSVYIYGLNYYCIWFGDFHFEIISQVQPVAELSELSRRSCLDGREIDLDDSNIRGGTLRRSGSKRFHRTGVSVNSSINQ